MARLEVIKGVASQRVWFYPPEGRPTSTPSVAVKDSSGSTVTAAATTYVTLDSVNTTVGTTGAVGDSSLVLTSVAGLEWRQSYLVTNALAQQEWVRVASINTSTRAVGFDEPLQYAHASGSTFVGTRFYYTLQTAEVDELVELYRARATYAVGGLNHVLEVPFDVVLTPLSSPLSVEFIKRRMPDIMGQEPAESRGTDFADFREQAWDRVKQGIREHGWRPALLRTPEDVEEWAEAEFKLICQAGGVQVLRGWDPERAVAYLQKERERAAEHSCRSLQFLDLDEDDAVSEDEEAPLRMSFIR